jgi:hypothetical protein
MQTVNLTTLTTADLIRKGRGIIARCFCVNRKATVLALYRQHLAARPKAAAA